MRASAPCALLVVLVTAIALLAPGARAAVDDGEANLAKLRALSKQGRNGLISMASTAEFEAVANGASRPYSIVVAVWLPAAELKRERAQIRKNAQIFERVLVDAAAAYGKTVDEGDRDVFFVKLEYNKDTHPLFMKFEIQSFPTLVVVQRNQAMHFNKETFGIDESMQAKSNNRKELFEYFDYALGTKGLFAEAAEEKVSISVVNIIVAYGVILILGRMLWTISARGLLVPLMAIGAVAVVWLSMSGFIKCIIHKLPMYTVDGEGRPQVFLKGDSRNQTILEGFMMSTAYVLIGCCVSALTFVWPYVKNESVKQFGTYATFIVGVGAYFLTIEAYFAKVHMSPRIYGINL